MSGILYAGFDYGTDAHLSDLWNLENTAVVVDPTGGRLAGAAFFDASLNSCISKTLVWGIDGPTPVQSFMGMAFRPTVIGGRNGITIAQLHLTSPDSTLRLLAFPSGSFVIRYDKYIDLGFGDEVVILGQYVCGSLPGQFLVGNGCYVEWSVRRGDTSGANTVYLRVNGVVVGAGKVTFDNTEEYAAFSLGGGNTVLGGLADEVGTWFVDDVYVLDGVPESAFTGPHGYVDNARFLGDVVVQGLYATHDAEEINDDPSYTPWVPASGTTHYTQINENPPDEGVTNESTDVGGTYGPPGTFGGMGVLDKYDSFKFLHPLQHVSHFGEMDPDSPEARSNSWPLYAVQVVASIAGVDAGLQATIRDTQSSPSDDPIELGEMWAPNGAYRYFNTIFDRHIYAPFSLNPIWRVGNFFDYPIELGPAPNFPTEFGIAQVAAEGSEDLAVFASRVVTDLAPNAASSWTLNASPALTGSGVLTLSPTEAKIRVTAFVTDPTNLIPDVPITSVKIHVTGAGSTTFNATQNASFDIAGNGSVGTLGGGGGPVGPKSFGPTSVVFDANGIFTRADLLAAVFGYTWQIPNDEGSGTGTGSITQFFIRVTFGTAPVPVAMDQEVVEIVLATSLFTSVVDPDSPWGPLTPPPVPTGGDPGPGGPSFGPGTGLFPPRVVTDQWQIHSIDMKPRGEERA